MLVCFTSKQSPIIEMEMTKMWVDQYSTGSRNRNITKAATNRKLKMSKKTSEPQNEKPALGLNAPGLHSSQNDFPDSFWYRPKQIHTLSFNCFLSYENWSSEQWEDGNAISFSFWTMRRRNSSREVQKNRKTRLKRKWEQTSLTKRARTHRTRQCVLTRRALKAARSWNV